MTNEENTDKKNETSDVGSTGAHRITPSGEYTGNAGGRLQNRNFSRRKVCPFVLDKSLILDFKNVRVMQRFVTETGRIVPRHISGVSAKNQRQLKKHIKRARNIGLIAPAIEG